MKQLTRRRFLALDAGAAVALGSNKLTPTGVDIITVGSNLLYGPDTAFRAISAIRGLVERGEIPPERINQSYSRIMRPKALI